MNERDDNMTHRIDSAKSFVGFRLTFKTQRHIELNTKTLVFNLHFSDKS